MESWKLVCAGGAIALAGMALGAWLFGPEPARAQQGAYERCIAVKQESIDVNNEGNVAPVTRDHTVLIPPGWEVIGGGGAPSLGVIVLCHR